MDIQNNNALSEKEYELNDDNNDDNISWPQIKNYLHQNLTVIKITLIILTLLFIYYIWQTPVKHTQMGGGLGKMGKASPISGGFTLVFQFVNNMFMIFGIVIILILIPTIPIIIFLVISYFICRRKLWDLRTM
jgi:hypothetical protein